MKPLTIRRTALAAKQCDEVRDRGGTQVSLSSPWNINRPASLPDFTTQGPGSQSVSLGLLHLKHTMRNQRPGAEKLQHLEQLPQNTQGLLQKQHLQEQKCSFLFPPLLKQLGATWCKSTAPTTMTVTIVRTTRQP